jgi:DNA-binding XRE family transcriptional regulator
MTKLSELRSIDEVVDERRSVNPEFRERWDRSAFAREVAVKVIAYRAEHELTQTQLARDVGMTQSVIGRLELGEHPPSLATLAKLTARTGLEFHLDITGGDVALSA